MNPLIHFQRRPTGGQVSIERLFDEIREHLPDSWPTKVAVSPHFSRGLLPRLKNLAWASQQAGAVNHIVGDAHYLAFGLSGKRTVLTIHDCAALNRLQGWRRTILLHLWFIGPMKWAAAVTTISQTTKDELRKWTGALADRVVVIPNCVRTEFTPSPKAFNSANPTILQVGTGWNKNVGRIAESLRGIPCILEIVGNLSDSQRTELAATGVQFHELGRLSDDELVAAYRRCDIVAFVSLYEGFGLPILEGQATGRPVITSNRSAMPEAAGDGAFFVDPESVDSIRDAMLRLIADADKRNDLIERGFVNVERFRPRAISSKYAEIYASLLTPAN